MFDHNIFIEICKMNEKKPMETALAESYVKKYLLENKKEVLNSLVEIYMGYTNKSIRISILCIIRNISMAINSGAIIIAKMAVADSNRTIQKLGIQCFKNWKLRCGIGYLQNMDVDDPVLIEYRDKAVYFLRKVHNIRVSK